MLEKTLRNILVLAAMGLAACMPAGSQSKPTITLVLLPTETAALQPTATSILATDEIGPSATPAAGPTGTPEASPTASPAFYLAPGAQAFRDCSLAPGWVGCDPSQPALDGRMALVDRAAMRVVALDLSSAQAWQSAGHPSWLEWSPDGQALLLGHQTDGGMEYNLLRGGAEGQLPSASDAVLHWQPDGALGSTDEVHNEQGDVARLEMTSDMRWLLHATSGGQTRQLTLEELPTDRMYALVGWVPGSSLVLAQAYYASNAAMLTGGQLLTIDTRSGEKQMLDAIAPLDGSATFRWSPASGARSLAFLASFPGERSTGGRLGVIDFATGQLRYPLPEGFAAQEIAWSPDGSRIAITALPGEGSQPSAAQRVFSAPGIYQVDVETAEATLLVPQPEGAIAGWPQFTADGSTLIYAVAVLQPGGDPQVSVHARALDGGADRALVEGLPGPPPARGQVQWDQILAFHP